MLTSRFRDYLRMVVVAIAVMILGGSASAQNRYAVIHIKNTTKDVTIQYHLRWGTTGEWGKQVELAPGKGWTHWYTYETIDQNHSPIPQITFSSGINRTRTVQNYSLDAYASPEKTSGGKLYHFEKLTDADGEDFIQLYAIKNNAQTARKPEAPAPGVTRYQEGVKSMEAKQYDAAIEAFTDAIAKSPNDTNALLYRAEAYRMNKQYDKALADLNTAIKIGGTIGVAYNLRGVVYENMEQFDKALNDYSRAISIQPDLVFAYRNRANLHSQQGRYQEAVVDLRQALTKQSAPAVLASLHFNLGFAYYSLKQYEAAIAAYDAALAADSRFVGALSNRASAHYRRGDYFAAVRDAEAAIQIEPDFPHAYRWRSQAYARVGDDEAAKRDYFKAISLDPAQKERFEYTAFLVDRREALAALDSYRLGRTLTPAVLRALNELPGGEPTEEARGEMAGNARELIASERQRYDGLQFEMVAAANMLLKASAMSPADRGARGWKLGWLFGPVSAPNSRAGSKDGLAGLRLIGRLELPGGQEIYGIAAVKFYPPKDPNADEEGRVGLLSDVDNFRLEVRLFEQGTTLADYAHQSFAIAAEGSRLTMRPGLNVHTKTGKLVSQDLAFPALSTSCINCHSAGPRLKPENLTLMANRDYRRMDGFREFLEQSKHWSASKKFRQRIEELMAEQGPTGLLPLDEMIKANREQWLNIYPLYKDRLKTPFLVTGSTAARAPQRR